MPVPAVERDHQRHRGLAVPVLGYVEREPPALGALVVGVQHAHRPLIIAQRGGAQARHQGVVPAPRRLHEPAAHRLQRGRERIEPFLERREATERAVEADGIVRDGDGGHERVDQREGLPGGLGEPVAHEGDLGRPRERFEGAQGGRQRLALRGQHLAELLRHGREEVTLHPGHTLEGAEHRAQEVVERARDVRAGGHVAILPRDMIRGIE